MSRTRPFAALSLAAGLASLAPTSLVRPVAAQPQMTDPRFTVATHVSGLGLPTTMAFIGPNDLLVLEKNTGRVVRVTNGTPQGPVLDLSVNFASERGLLGIALDPDFPDDPGVYLYWSCASTSAPTDSFMPSQTECTGPPALGADVEDILQAPLLGNRVDRFEWNGSSLTYERNLITLRSFQNDGGPDPPDQGDDAQPPRANHDGGIIRFGPDGKLYVIVGDLGRRGQLQNLPSGPTLTGLGPVVDDDQFGGPEPDRAHLGGVILRLNEDGTTPTDNPFYAAGANLGGEVGTNVQKIFAYGVRNSFGMAFDPKGGNLWYQDNGEDAYDELNRVDAGANGGWIQIMGPLERVPDYRAIEDSSLHAETFPNLQQLRWGPERIATTSAEAESRLFMLPGAHYNDPEFSWRHVVAPAAVGFIDGSGLGNDLNGDMFVGLSVPNPMGGPLLHFRMAAQGRKIVAGDPALNDKVDDNSSFNTLGESASLVIGTGFGVVTDIQTGTNGNLFVVSLSNGAIYEISRIRQAGSQGKPRSGAMVDADGLHLWNAGQGTGESVIRYALETAATVRLSVHDVSGRSVAVLADGMQAGGEYTVRWSATGLPPGVYFARLERRGDTPASRTIKLVSME
jgi:glucose/arabinose dehydrogenase